MSKVCRQERAVERAAPPVWGRPGGLRPERWRVDIDDAGGAAEGWARLLRRPSGLVEQTRWMLWLAVLAGLMLVLPWVLDARSPVSLPLALVAMPCLIACWTGRYLTRQSPLPLDLGEALATAALATA